MKLVIKTDEERSKLEALKYVVIIGTLVVAAQWTFVGVQAARSWYSAHYPSKAEASQPIQPQTTAETSIQTTGNRPCWFDPILCL